MNLLSRFTLSNRMLCQIFTVKEESSDQVADKVFLHDFSLYECESCYQYYLSLSLPSLFLSVPLQVFVLSQRLLSLD